MSLPQEPIRSACPKCGYDLRGVEAAQGEIRCPECGIYSPVAKLGFVGDRPRRLTLALHLVFSGAGGLLVLVLLVVAGAWSVLAGFAQAFGNQPITYTTTDRAVFLTPFVVWAAVLLVANRAFAWSFARYRWDRPNTRALVQTGILGGIHIALVVLAVIVLVAIFTP